MKKFMLISRVFLVVVVLLAVYLMFNLNISINVNQLETAARESKLPPKAVAGIVVTRLTIYGGKVAHLDGSGSYDQDGGEIVRYKWVVVDSPQEERLGQVIYDGPVAKAPDQTYRLEDVGTWVYELEVTDDEGQTSRDTKTVIVQEKVETIITPKKVDAREADFINPGDFVLGVFINDEAVAYPAKVVYPHVVVNDVVGHESIYVVYCEACQTGTVKKRTVNGQVLTFKGLGGTLEEDKFLYNDQETGSQWHIVYGEAKSGPLSGVKLDDVDFELVSWREWQERHPDTLVVVGE